MNVLVKDSTAQFKLDRTHVQHGFDTKINVFHFTRVHARLMMSNLLYEALVNTLYVWTTV